MGREAAKNNEWAPRSGPNEPRSGQKHGMGRAAAKKQGMGREAAQKSKEWAAQRPETRNEPPSGQKVGAFEGGWKLVTDTLLFVGTRNSGYCLPTPRFRARLVYFSLTFDKSRRRRGLRANVEVLGVAARSADL